MDSLDDAPGAMTENFWLDRFKHKHIYTEADFEQFNAMLNEGVEAAKRRSNVVKALFEAAGLSDPIDLTLKEEGAK